VASKLLGPRVGVVSGSALLVDYVLTISVSIAAACDAVWSFLPAEYTVYKLAVAFAVVAFMIVLNLRGVRESVTFLAPIFLLFVGTHAFMILYVIGSRLTGLPAVFHDASVDFHESTSALGYVPVLLILLRAYSMGGGTYTGIEAVSNGVAILREPRVRTGKRTMFLMATSLAFTAGGILFAYLLTNSQPVAGKTMNAVLMENVFGSWTVGGVAFGSWFVMIALVSEAALLFVAAQAGFLDGPRILANMAVDSWMPRRFAELSDRLVTKNGVLLMGISAIGTLIYTKGNITTLVVMYSINVFLTFSLTELGMAKHWIVDRHKEPRWKSQLAIHGTGLVMCVGILAITLFEKFSHGGWVTALITTAVIFMCFMIRRHYDHVRKGFQQLDEVLRAAALPELKPQGALEKNDWTAILPVTSFSGFGIHHLLAINKLFPGHFKNIVFVSVGAIDSGTFKGAEEIINLETQVRENIEKYMKWAQQYGLKTDYRMALATETIPVVERICRDLCKEFPKSIVFSGKLIFRKERWYQRILHNESALALQRRLHLDGIPTMVLPIRA
jgi:amino acid transporter